jgi:Zn-dependent peptidase ImmA (M78 family)/transcriptional regulator with XRE-family HTH domain
MSTKHDETAKFIAAQKGVSYNQGPGPDIRTPRQIIEVETADTITDAAQQLRGYRGPVYVVGVDTKATEAALEHYKETTIGVMDASGKILKPSTRKRASSMDISKEESTTEQRDTAIMVGERLKRFRLARGVSLDDLEAAIDGLVSKQALSKYERGKMQPKVTTLNQIAAALGVKSAQLWGESTWQVEWVAYRKRTRMGKKEQEQLQSLVAEVLEKRVSLLERLGERNSVELPIREFPVSKIEDAEGAALALRQQWDLGVAPVTNLVGVLEDHFIHIIEVEAIETFDGISAVVRDNEKNVLSAAIATRRGTPGDRHRFNIAHELGHLTLKLKEGVNAEKAAFRFGAAFLVPAEELRREVGDKRSRIQSEELQYLKWRYGMSIQAILYRLKDLRIITNSHYKQWCVDINKLGWKKREPIEIPPEKPRRFHQQVFHALSEELIEAREAEQLLNDTLETASSPSLIERRAFFELPTDLRRNLLREQAKQMADYYQNDPEWRELEGVDLVEYKPT